MGRFARAIACIGVERELVITDTFVDGGEVMQAGRLMQETSAWRRSRGLRDQAGTTWVG